jgi:alpha-D-ribose 1-methylphosphonate 5-triphosphate synthase subunit PhnG
MNWTRADLLALRRRIDELEVHADACAEAQQHEAVRAAEAEMAILIPIRDGFEAKPHLIGKCTVGRPAMPEAPHDTRRTAA